LLWFGAAATNQKPTLSTGRVLKLGCKREMVWKQPNGLLMMENFLGFEGSRVLGESEMEKE
jgi:hypothetical protein